MCAARCAFRGLSAWLEVACEDGRSVSSLSVGAQPESASSAASQMLMSGSGDILIEPLPGEMGTWIGLAAGCDIAVPDHRLDRVGLFQQFDERGQGRVLGFGEGQVVGAFEFDADGKVVAAFVPLPA